MQIKVLVDFLNSGSSRSSSMKTLLRIIGIAVLVAAVVEFFRAASLNPHTSNSALAACGILIVLGTR